ncbi:hypothetical protein M0813_25127 [Anaeramoeba flamelloides]|uniref:Uncharacterized protein n=1 Tax=Anaeramoeba flamelloides TaxID=1746091 RepID=A0ABQ8Y3W5_9EUKA|nr:hypothetical protein M0813_25127 [Anaeramoeba flamelloides]
MGNELETNSYSSSNYDNTFYYDDFLSPVVYSSRINNFSTTNNTCEVEKSFSQFARDQKSQNKIKESRGQKNRSENNACHGVGLGLFGEALKHTRGQKTYKSKREAKQKLNSDSNFRMGLKTTNKSFHNKIDNKIRRDMNSTNQRINLTNQRDAQRIRQIAKYNKKSGLSETGGGKTLDRTLNKYYYNGKKLIDRRQKDY